MLERRLALVKLDLWQPDDEILKVIVGKYNDLDEVKEAFETRNV